jgi:hypothetical protein
MIKCFRAEYKHSAEKYILIFGIHRLRIISRNQREMFLFDGQMVGWGEEKG